MRILVLGAGLAGVTCAWRLARDGHAVRVLEQADGIATQASGANDGIATASRAIAWANPRLARALACSLFDGGQPLRAQADAQFWRWGVEFLRQCRAATAARVFERALRLARYAQAVLGDLVAETGIEYGRLDNGVLYVHRDRTGLQAGAVRAAQMQKRGLAIRVLDALELARLEPAFAASHGRLAGALYCARDEAGDAARFCRALAAHAHAAGVEFLFGRRFEGFALEGMSARAARTDAGEIEADAFVVALGVIEPALRGAFGVRLPVYPVRRWSVTLPLADRAAAPRHAGMDETKAIAWCPMAEGLRVTGGTAFAGRAALPDDGREARRLADIAEALFPGATARADIRARACRRPMTPDGLPRYGTARWRNVWFGVGHGGMGWAMAPGSAAILADLIAGRAPAVELDGLRL